MHSDPSGGPTQPQDQLAQFFAELLRLGWRRLLRNGSNRSQQAYRKQNQLQQAMGFMPPRVQNVVLLLALLPGKLLLVHKKDFKLEWTWTSFDH